MSNVDEKDIVDGITYAYSNDWIRELESEEHWRLYWQQQALLEESLEVGDTVLEIGPGSGFATNYLRAKGIEVTTVDIDEEKNPDIVANIVTYDFPKSYDFVLAFEVFEHIPFEEFEKAIEKLSDKCRKEIIISVPKSEWVLFRAQIRLPILKNRSFELTLPKRESDEPHHFWEVGTDGVDLQKIDTVFRKNGFLLEKRIKRFSRYFMRFKKEK